MYNAYQVSEIVGIPYRTLMNWVEWGVVEIHKYPGRRRAQAKFSERDLREIEILAKLRGKVSLQRIRKIRDYLKRLGCNPFSKGHFLVVGDGDDVIRVCGEKEAISLLRQPGQLYLVIPLDKQ